MNNENIKILIVEDDPVSGQLLSKLLEKRKFLVKLITSGTECLQIIDDEKYDLVLLDIMMPDISGLEVLDHIRRTKDTTQLPVIMVTAKVKDQDIVDALRRGANDYITKPVNIDVAMARIKTHMEMSHLIKESLSLKQAATITKMVGTLNHEINNPLAIALGNISILQKEYEGNTKLEKAAKALDRITDLVKKIKDISDSGKGMEEIEYSSDQQIFKIK